MSLIDDIKFWWRESVNKDALIETIFQRNTLFGLFSIAVLVGWKIAPDKITAIVEGLLLLYGIWKVARNEKKAIRKKADEL